MILPFSRTLPFELDADVVAVAADLTMPWDDQCPKPANRDSSVAGVTDEILLGSNSMPSLLWASQPN